MGVSEKLKARAVKAQGFALVQMQSTQLLIDYCILHDMEREADVQRKKWKEHLAHFNHLEAWCKKHLTGPERWVEQGAIDARNKQAERNKMLGLDAPEGHCMECNGPATSDCQYH